MLKGNIRYSGTMYIFTYSNTGILRTIIYNASTTGQKIEGAKNSKVVTILTGQLFIGANISRYKKRFNY